MVRNGKTAQEFIQSSFSPIVAILCSSRVESIVSRNNLSFTELLQPFTTLESDGQFREPGGNYCTVKSWKLILRNVSWKPLQPTEARKQLNNAVLHNYNDRTVKLEIAKDGKKFDIPQSTPWFDAWRETYLEVQFPSDHEFTKHFVSCIIVATTYDENIIDTFNSLNQQYAQLQNVTPPKLPKWFNNGVLKSYLLLHDASAVPKEKADALFETVKQTFGTSNCFMLSINSKSNVDTNLATDHWAPFIKRSSESNYDLTTSSTNPSTPSEAKSQHGPSIASTDDSNIVIISNQETPHPLTANENDSYDNANSLQTHSFSGSSESMNVANKPVDYSTEIHGAALNTNDIDAIKRFLQDYATKALLPYLEKQIAQLSEAVANKKGVSRSLFSATKRWFGTGKAGNTTGSNTVIYTNDCPELQLRRLGDLWFLCGQWQRAYDTYHTAKREFYADSAWLCYAGALEMAAISAFMGGEANRKTHGYMEESIVTYLNTCRMVQYAVRATLLSVLCLNGAGLHGEAAKQLIRMTSEDSDLRSAMLLEQASLCFLSGPGSKAMSRKYAFHMVLAGHRFSKAGQKKHAYRCYKQAYQVYEESGWRLSTDHVQFALGRLAGALKQSAAAVRWLAAPLAPASLQPPAQQDAFLREYTQAHQQWIESNAEMQGRMPELPLPRLVDGATAVLCAGPAPLAAPGRVPATSLAINKAQDVEEDKECWHKLEEMLLQVADGSLPMIFKPTVDLHTNSTDSNPVVPQGEPVQISITLSNPLKISLIIKDVELLWRFTPSFDGADETDLEVFNNEPMVAVGIAVENNVIVGQKIKSVVMEGDCEKALMFSITPLRVGQLNIHGLAYKLVNGGEHGIENGHSKTIAGKVNLSSSNNEKLLNITVIPESPCLQMTFTETSSEAISNELRMIDMELRNVGPVDMEDIHIAVSHPDGVALITEESGDDFKELYEEKYQNLPPHTDDRSARNMYWRGSCARHVWRVRGGGRGGGCARARLVVRPAARLRLLAHYRTAHRHRHYRLLRHVFHFDVLEAVEVTITPRRSLMKSDGNIVENMILNVELKNVSNENDDISIEVVEASLISRQWKLIDITTVKNDRTELISHEKGHFIFKAKRILEDIPEGKVEHSCLKVDSKYFETSKEFAPYYKYITDFRPSYIDCPDPINQNSQSRTGLIQSMFVIRWKAHNKSKGCSAIGQHCLWIECFSKVVSRKKEIIATEQPTLHLDDSDNTLEYLDSKQKKRKDDIIFRLEHADVIQHNFKERRLCLVPITISIVNCYDLPVNVFINLEKQQNRDTQGELGWAGALSESTDENGTGIRVVLGRFESRRVAARALAAAPGSYLVGAPFAVTAISDSQLLPVTHHVNNTSLLVVQQITS